MLDVAHGGHCVARHEGRVVFVRHALPGERVVVEVTSGTDRSSFLRADAVEVLAPSPQRREAPCRFAGPGGCGGCDWQHTSAAFGRELKARVVAEQLRRLAGIERDVIVQAVPGDADGLRWRTRIELAVDANGAPGLRRHRSHDVIDIDDCLIATDAVAGSGALAHDWPGARAVEVAASSTGEVSVIPAPSQQHEPTLHEVVPVGDGALTLEVGARGFWQVHPGAARTLADAVLRLGRPGTGERVLDLYSGVGLFAAALAGAVGEQGSVTAVEGAADALPHAEANLAAYSWALPETADVRAWLAQDRRRTADVDLVVLDPPRTGVGAEVLSTLLQGRPRAVVYVACDPAALARDVATAARQGYVLKELEAFDLFPMTHHVECVALLEQASAAD